MREFHFKEGEFSFFNRCQTLQIRPCTEEKYIFELKLSLKFYSFTHYHVLFWSILLLIQPILTPRGCRLNHNPPLQPSGLRGAGEGSSVRGSELVKDRDERVFLSGSPECRRQAGEAREGRRTGSQKCHNAGKKKKRWFKGFVFMLNGLFPRVQNTQPCRSDVFKTCKCDKLCSSNMFQVF